MESASSLGPLDPALPGTAGHEAGSRASFPTEGPTEGHRPTEINALLGRGTHFEGKLFFEGRVRIDGGFKGEIQGDDVLVIGEGALVSGEVRVATCIVTGGDVDANIRARDAIELYAPARVKGSLHAPAIFIDRGVKFEGSCKMAPLDEDETGTLPSPDPSTAPLGAHGRGGSAVRGGAEIEVTPAAGTILPPGPDPEP